MTAKLEWKHIACGAFSNKLCAFSGKVRVFEIFYNACCERGNKGESYVLVPLLPGFNKERYCGPDEVYLKEKAEKMMQDWIEAAGL